MGQVAEAERVRGNRFGVLAPALALACLFAPAAADAAPSWMDMFDFSGYEMSDVRFDIDNYRGPTPGQGYTFSLNRNDVDLKLQFEPHPGVVAVIDTRLRYYGFVSSQTLAVADLWNASAVPLHRVPGSGLRRGEGRPGPWIDLKAGRMQQTWGSVDVFSPNDNMNSRDFSDPLDYTRKVPTRCWRSTPIRPPALTLNAVWVPIFQPSCCPRPRRWRLPCKRTPRAV
jgi:hypothetical protein